MCDQIPPPGELYEELNAITRRAFRQESAEMLEGITQPISQTLIYGSGEPVLYQIFRPFYESEPIEEIEPTSILDITRAVARGG